MSEQATCPSCGWRLDFAPWNRDLPSDGICPCCGIHFGYDDFAGGEPSKRAGVYDAWRKRWARSGFHWFSASVPPPNDWNPEDQLRRVAEQRPLASKRPSLKQIEDAQERTGLETIVSLAVERPNHIKAGWLATPGRVAVPVESASHFTREDAERLSAAMNARGVRDCFAVATELLRDTVLYWKLPTTTDALMQFSRECSLFNFVLVPESGEFYVLCTTDDFFILAGPEAFVRDACGGDIERARREFREFVFEDRLARVAARYEAAGA